MKRLDVLIREDQLDNLRRLAFLRHESLAQSTRFLLDRELGSIDATIIKVKHPEGKEEEV